MIQKSDSSHQTPMKRVWIFHKIQPNLRSIQSVLFQIKAFLDLTGPFLGKHFIKFLV